MSRHGRSFRLEVLGIGAFTVAAAVVFFYFLTLSGVGVIPRATYTLHVKVPNVVAMSNHADVREAGVQVGSVNGIAVAGDQAALTLSLERRYAPVYADAQVQIRGKTLAGENYVALDPGSPKTGAIRNGGTLATRGPEATQLDQILSTFDAPHRRDVQRILDVLGAGIGGRGADLHGFLGGTADLVNNAAPVSSVLAAEHQQVASLIDDFGRVSDALGRRTADIRKLVTTARSASEAIAARDQQVRATLRALPGFLAQAKMTVSHLGAFSLGATPVMRDLRLATTALVPAVGELRPAASAATAIVHELGPFADATTSAAASLRLAAPALTALAPPLQAALQQANPMLAYLVNYAGELGWWFPSQRAPTEFHDASGGYVRLAAVISPNLLSGISPAEDKVVRALVNTGVLAVASKMQSNPYPRPRAMDHPLVPFTGAYPRIQADPPYAIHG
jgi:phospholipid/cholesterol/gamma-HCH transport system substrate-binding protein